MFSINVWYLHSGGFQPAIALGWVLRSLTVPHRTLESPSPPLPPSCTFSCSPSPLLSNSDPTTTQGRGDGVAVAGQSQGASASPLAATFSSTWGHLPLCPPNRSNLSQCRLRSRLLFTVNSIRWRCTTPPGYSLWFLVPCTQLLKH